MTSRRLCSMPSSSRRRQCPASSRGGGTGSIQTWPSITVTGKARTSSAKGLKVPPLESSNRAWCQWQVRMPSLTLPRSSGKPMWGQRLSTAYTWSPWLKTAIACPPPVTTVQPRSLTSFRVPAFMCPLAGVVMAYPPSPDGKGGKGSKSGFVTHGLARASSRTSRGGCNGRQAPLSHADVQGRLGTGRKALLSDLTGVCAASPAELSPGEGHRPWPPPVEVGDRLDRTNRPPGPGAPGHGPTMSRARAHAEPAGRNRASSSSSMRRDCRSPR